jgi:hypothetical protein
MVCGNPVIGQVVGAGSHRVVENVETTTTCIRYVPSVLSCQASVRAKRSESCSAPQRPRRQLSCSRELGSNEEMGGLLQRGRPHVD